MVSLKIVNNKKTNIFIFYFDEAFRYISYHHQTTNVFHTSLMTDIQRTLKNGKRITREDR